MKNKAPKTKQRTLRHLLYALLCVVTFACTATAKTTQDYTIENDSIIINKSGLYEIRAISDSIYSVKRIE